MGSILEIVYKIFENIEYYLILGLVFMTATSASAAMALLFFRRDRVADRLSRFLSFEKQGSKGKTPLLQEESGGMIAKLSNPLHSIAAPSDDAIKKRLKLKLVQAGFRSKQAYRNFLASKVIFAVALPVIYLGQAIFYVFNIKSMLICFFLFCLGFYLPNLILCLFIQKRQEGILRAVPDTLDLMVVCVEAGLGLDMVFKRVGDEIRPICEDLSDEFYLTNLEVQAGKSREESLRNLALRTGVSEVQNLVTILIQTSRLGTSLAKTLRVHADAMRTKRRQVAEERAAKAAVKLVFPLIFFILPAMFVVLVGPAAVRIVKTLFPALGQ